MLEVLELNVHTQVAEFSHITNAALHLPHMQVSAFLFIRRFYYYYYYLLLT